MRERTRRAAVLSTIRFLVLLLPFLGALLGLGWAGAAGATPSVFMDPPGIMVTPGEEFEVSFRVDDCGDSVASYQLYMSFDPDVVELVEATEGTLYAQSGFMTWFIEEEEDPGFWHFFDTVFGAGTFVVPPGELLHLTFRALPGAVGCTPAHIDTIRMTNVLRDPLPLGTASDALICVPGTGVDAAARSSSIGPASPNPFVGGTRIRFSRPDAREGVRMNIYDVSGRLVRRLSIPSGVRCGEVEWNGRTDEGTAAAPGVYLAAIEGRGGAARTKLVKLH